MSNNPLQSLINLGTSPLISASANLSQLTDLGLQIKDLSNTQLLVKLQERFERQDKTYLENLTNYIVRLISDNEKLQQQNELIMSQNLEIIKLLKK